MVTRLSDYIVPEYFFGAFFAGLVYALVTSPGRTVLLKHPTPFNLDTVTYQDRTANCYRFTATEAVCPGRQGPDFTPQVFTLSEE
jgi:hypothetical protein